MEKLRTIAQAAAEIKKIDPESALTEWALRQLVKDGEIPTMKCGNKALLSMASLERYIASQFEGGRP